MSYLLDTNVVSEVRKPKPNPRVLDWLASVSYHQLHLSVLVLGEIRKGIEGLRRRDPAKASAFEEFLDDLTDDYDDRVVAVDEQVAEAWGRLAADEPTVPVVDGLMAATALAHDWTLVTRNTKNVERTGVKLLNPFADD